MKTCFSVCRYWVSRWWQRQQHKRTGFSVVRQGVDGQAITPLLPRGFVCLSGELWAAQSPLHIMPGEAVTVVGSQGVWLVVYPKEASLNKGIAGSQTIQAAPKPSC
jgi:membrane-bound ClpP family serine protease